MRGRILRWVGLVWVGLAAACGSSPECPPGFRMDGEVCVTAAGRLEGTAGVAGETSDDAGIRVALLGTDRIATTDGEGRWSMDGVDPDAYTLRFSREGLATVDLDVVVSGQGVTTVDPVELGPRTQTTRVVGSVSATGPVEGALVYLEHTSHIALAGADGAFALESVLPGTYTLVVRLEGYLRHEQSLVLEEPDETFSVEPIDLLPAAGPDGPVGTLTGRVTLNGAGSGNAGVQVYLEGTGYVGFTDDDGGFLLDHVAAGEYTLHAVAPGFTAGVLDGVVVRAREVTVADALDLRPAAPVVGTVNGNVKPLGISDGSGTTVRLVGSSGLVAETVTGSDGGYAFDAVPPGLYRIDFEHPPWQPKTLEPVVVAEGRFLAPPSTLYLGRRVDERPLESVEFLSGERALLRLRTDGPPAAVLYDAARDLKVALPEGEAIPMADRVDRDHVFVLSRQVLAGVESRKLYDVDLTAGEAFLAAWEPTHAFGFDDGVLYADEAQRVWDQRLDGSEPSLVAEPPCAGAIVEGFGAGPSGTLRVQWRTWACEGTTSGGAQFYQPEGRTLSTLALTWIVNEAETGAAIFVRDDLASQDRPRIVHVSFPDLAEKELVKELDQHWEISADGLLVQHHGDPTTGRGSMVWVALDGTVTPLLDDASVRVNYNSDFHVLLYGASEDVWVLNQKTLETFPACTAPSFFWNHEGHLLCRFGSSEPYTLTLQDLTLRKTRTLSTNASAANADGGYRVPMVATWRDATSGTWFARRADVADTQTLCTGSLYNASLAADRSSVAFMCRSGGQSTIRLQSLTASVSWDVLPEVATLTGYPKITAREAELGVVAFYSLSTVGTTTADCGQTSCLVAWSATTGQRQVVPAPYSDYHYPSVMWGRDGLGVAATLQGVAFHLRFGQSANWVSSSEWGWPEQVGPGGRIVLWRTSDGFCLTDASFGWVGRWDPSHSPACLADRSWCIAGNSIANLGTGDVSQVGEPIDLTFTADRAAATWMFGDATYGGFARLSTAGLQTLAHASRRMDDEWILADQVWGPSGQAPRGRLMWRDPETGLLSEVADDVFLDVEQTGAGALLWRDPSPSENRGDLVYTQPGGALLDLGASASLSEPLWRDPATDGAEAAFNGWTPAGLRLMTVTLDGSAPEAWGPRASDARFGPGGHVSFSAGGAWWHVAPGGALPVDRAEFLTAAAVSADGRRVAYGVEGMLWPDAGRRGTWFVELP